MRAGVGTAPPSSVAAALAGGLPRPHPRRSASLRQDRRGGGVRDSARRPNSPAATTSSTRPGRRRPSPSSAPPADHRSLRGHDDPGWSGCVARSRAHHRALVLRRPAQEVPVASAATSRIRAAEDASRPDRIDDLPEVGDNQPDHEDRDRDGRDARGDRLQRRRDLLVARPALGDRSRAEAA